MIHVVYQYLKGAAKGNELKYSLRSIAKYLDEEFKVWFVGDLPDDMELEHVENIPHDRVLGIPFTNAYDSLKKLNKVLLHPEMGEKIIYMYDDIVLTRKTTFEELQQFTRTFATQNLAEVEKNTNTVHRQLIWQTAAALEGKGLTIYNGETHAPRAFLKSEMIEVFKAFKPIKNRLLPFTLLLNFKKDQEFILAGEDSYKVGFYGEKNEPLSYKPESKKEVQDFMRKYLVINFNDAGYTQAVEEALATRFKDSCKYEV